MSLYAPVDVSLNASELARARARTCPLWNVSVDLSSYVPEIVTSELVRSRALTLPNSNAPVYVISNASVIVRARARLLPDSNAPADASLNASEIARF